MYQLIFMSQAQKDAKNLSSSGLKEKAMQLLEIIQKNPLQYPPEYEYLKGDMQGLISRRINKQHRLVYEIFEEQKVIRVYRMWKHYE
ncbi:toxin-antitoxin system, toxin component, Txe/YoeB family [Arcobacter venerupis]|uniref:Putative mRNA interferase YoeB n=1 Tax=Arcobacter venerupis TaxID=1054033 RepID=A0AAE7B7N5_9BACT|nr:Txe/YoeB family addiction module toxin [Arcobacter venerupis]QKF66824.1 toxin-antitoxin system, toxin component, Txe/YoeB family [Arcobacter venerupis]RWS49820.1 Txe/YoeB family addiction module toxin [Arcobacter venerupis]